MTCMPSAAAARPSCSCASLLDAVRTVGMNGGSFGESVVGCGVNRGRPRNRGRARRDRAFAGPRARGACRSRWSRASLPPPATTGPRAPHRPDERRFAAGGTRAAQRPLARSSSSMAVHATPGVSSAARGGASGRIHASIGSPVGPSRSSRWLPTKPAAPVTRMGPFTSAQARAVLRLIELAECRILFFDGTPPPLVLAVPGHRGREALGEVSLRRPSQPTELGRVEL